MELFYEGFVQLLESYLNDDNREEFEILKSIQQEQSFKGYDQTLTSFISKINKDKFDKDLDILIKSSDFVFDINSLEVLKCNEQFLLSSLEKDFNHMMITIGSLLYRIKFSDKIVDIDIVKQIIRKNIDNIENFKSFVIESSTIMKFCLDTSEKIFEYSLNNNFEKTMDVLRYNDNSIKEKASPIIDNYVKERLDKYKDFVLERDNIYLVEISPELMKISLNNNFEKTIDELRYSDNSIKEKALPIIDNYVKEHLDKYKDFVLERDNIYLVEFSPELVKISLNNNFEKTMDELARLPESNLTVVRKILKEEKAKNSQNFDAYFNSRMIKSAANIDWCKEAFILSDDYLCDFVEDIPSFVTYILKSTFSDCELSDFSKRLRYNNFYFHSSNDVRKLKVMPHQLGETLTASFQYDFNKSIMVVSKKCQEKYIIDEKDKDILIKELKKHTYSFDDDGYKFMKIFSHTKVFDYIKNNMTKNENDRLYCDIVHAIDESFINCEPLIQILKSQDIDSIVYTSDIIKKDIIAGLWLELPKLMGQIGVKKMSKLMKGQALGCLPDCVIGNHDFLNEILKDNYNKEQIGLLYDIIDNIEYSPELETKFLQLVKCEYKDISEYISSFAFNGLTARDMTIEQRAALKLYGQKKMMKEMGRGVKIHFIVDNFGDISGTYSGNGDIAIVTGEYILNDTGNILKGLIHECNHAVQEDNIKNGKFDKDLDVFVYSKDKLLRTILGEDYYDDNYWNISYEFDAQFKAEIEESKLKGVSAEALFNNIIDEINEAYEEDKDLILKTQELGYSNKMVRVYKGVECGQESLFSMKLKSYLENSSDINKDIKEIEDNYPLIALGYDLNDKGRSRSLEEMLDIINKCNNANIERMCWFIIKERFDKGRFVKDEEQLMYSDLDLLEEYKFFSQNNHELAINLKESIEKCQINNVKNKMQSNIRAGW